MQLIGNLQHKINKYSLAKSLHWPPNVLRANQSRLMDVHILINGEGNRGTSFSMLKDLLSPGGDELVEQRQAYAATYNAKDPMELWRERSATHSIGDAITDMIPSHQGLKKRGSWFWKAALMERQEHALDKQSAAKKAEVETADTCRGCPNALESPSGSWDMAETKTAAHGLMDPAETKRATRGLMDPSTTSELKQQRVCGQGRSVRQDAGVDLVELIEYADSTNREDGFDARAGAAERGPVLHKLEVKSKPTERLTRSAIMTQESQAGLLTSDNESERHAIKGLCWRAPSLVDTRTVPDNVETFCDRSRGVAGKEYYYSREENSSMLWPRMSAEYCGCRLPV